jgi:hypothetical protein
MMFLILASPVWSSAAAALQRYNTKNSKQIFPGKELPILLQVNRWAKNVEIYRSLTDTRMWKLGLRQSNSFSGNT